MSDFEDRVRRDLHRSADSVEPPPLLWRRVEDRLGRPQDRRAIAVLALAAVTVVAVALLAVTLHSNPSPKHVASVAPSTTEPEGIVVPVDQTTTTQSPTATSLPPSPTSTRFAPTAVPGPTTTTFPQNCDKQDLAFTTHTDKTTYGRGDAVNVTETIQNISPHRCNYVYGCPSAIIKDAANNWVWGSWDRGSGNPPRICAAVGNLEPLDPGEYSKTHPSETWDQEICDGPTATTTTTSTSASNGYVAPCQGSPAPSGQYSAWMNPAEPTKPAFFQIS